MKSLARASLIGLSVILPIVLSIQLVIWLVRKVAAWLRPMGLLIVPDQYYVPGMALVSLGMIAAFIGFSVLQRFTRMLVQRPGKLMERIPVVNYVYSTIKDFLDLVAGDTIAGQAVVWVRSTRWWKTPVSRSAFVITILTTILRRWGFRFTSPTPSPTTALMAFD